jgi:hypothetical protein
MACCSIDTVVDYFLLLLLLQSTAWCQKRLVPLP